MSESKDITKNLVLDAIKSRIEIESKKLIEEAKKELERKTPEIVTSVLLDITGETNFQTMVDRTIFTIKRK